MAMTAMGKRGLAGLARLAGHTRQQQPAPPRAPVALPAEPIDCRRARPQQQFRCPRDATTGDREAGTGLKDPRAGAFLQAAVPLAVFFLLQRFFVRGILAGSVKG